MTTFSIIVTRNGELVDIVPATIREVGYQLTGALDGAAAALTLPEFNSLVNGIADGKQSGYGYITWQALIDARPGAQDQAGFTVTTAMVRWVANAEAADLQDATLRFEWEFDISGPEAAAALYDRIAATLEVSA